MSNSEQLEEIEVLSSIYPSEFEMLPPLQDNVPKFKIHLVPSSTDDKHHGRSVITLHQILFSITFLQLQ